MADLRGSRWMKRAACIAFVLLAAASGGCRQGPWPLWKAYAAHFIDEQGRVIDHQAGDRTTSEGQAYALFFALVDNDRARFDKLIDWTQNNIAAGNLGAHLPGWLWGKAADGQWKMLDANPASDADCWIAYTLVEAGRLWKTPGYALLGRQMMVMIAAQEVADLPGFGSMLMPGSTALWVHKNTWTVNPSYVPLFLFERFQQLDPAGPWGAIAMNIPRLLRQSERHGFVMDWVDYVPGDGFYPAPGPGSAPPEEQPKSSAPAQAPAAQKPAAAEPAKPAGAAAASPKPATKQPASTQPVSAQQGQAASAAKAPMGSYDAIRVYLWAGMIDSAGRARADILDSLAGMGAYVDHHGAPPESVSSEGVPQDQDGPLGFSAAILPYLWANPDLARTAAKLRVSIASQLNPATGLYGKGAVYYDQNLAMFGTGFLDGRYHFGPGGELKLEWTR
ncbi:MAG TPA: cellulose synthase complex periplasmic endoglucanase BcsZ [Terracidiphilus sp.]|nr:cellulose synthase complex periplasmic endoglucanase BcsZ [Terracidiphilus sp.]